MRRTRPLVLLDVDDVVADFVGAYMTVVRAISGDEQAKVPPYRSWHIWDDLSGHFSPERIEELRTKCHAHVRDTPDFCRGIHLIPGSVEAVAELRRTADVVFVTSPFRGSPTWAHERAEWLAEHFGPDLELISTKAKHHVDGDFLVDDNAQNVESWVAHRPGFGLLWRSGAASQDQPRVIAVREWNHVREIVSAWRPSL